MVVLFSFRTYLIEKDIYEEGAMEILHEVKLPTEYGYGYLVWKI